jgi:3-phenylpropionate/trans-cinnamate dioxygenase ferredoxin subunit
MQFAGRVVFCDPLRSLKSDLYTRNNVTDSTTTNKIEVCAAAELPAGAMRLVEHDGRKIGVFNCEGTLYAIEDRCSHDDGPLAEGEFDPATCTVECPRHGSLFDLATGRPKTLPAFAPVQTFPIAIEDDTITLEVE